MHSGDNYHGVLNRLYTCVQAYWDAVCNTHGECV